MTTANPRLFAIVLASLAAGCLLGMMISSQPATAAAPSHAQQQQPPAAGKQDAVKKDNDGDDDDDDETAIKLQDAPLPVQKTIAEMLGETMPKQLTRETDDGITTYEVVWVVEGQTRSADLSADGELLATETSIKNDELPKSLADLLAKHHPNATIKQAELVQERYFELVIMIDGKAHEVAINAAGELKGGEEDGKEHQDAEKGKGKDNDDDDDDVNDKD